MRCRKVGGGGGGGGGVRDERWGRGGEGEMGVRCRKVGGEG